MEYWLIINDTRVGPLSYEQVSAMNIYPNTPVWHQGLPDWVTAAEVPSLADIIVQPVYVQQPSYAQQQAQRPTEPCPSSYLVWSILATVFCCLIPGIIAIVYSSKVESRYIRGDYQGARNASENAQLWIIASIVFGLASIPLTFISTLLG